jgi:putative transposase
MARRLRVSSAGVPEHIIQRGNNRQATFACEEDMQAYVGWLKTYSKKHDQGQVLNFAQNSRPDPEV